MKYTTKQFYGGSALSAHENLEARFPRCFVHDFLADDCALALHHLVVVAAEVQVPVGQGRSRRVGVYSTSAAGTAYTNPISSAKNLDKYFVVDVYLGNIHRSHL